MIVICVFVIIVELSCQVAISIVASRRKKCILIQYNVPDPVWLELIKLKTKNLVSVISFLILYLNSLYRLRYSTISCVHSNRSFQISCVWDDLI